MDISPQFVEKVHRMFGHRGRAWLPELPRIAAECRARWGLSEGVPCPTMSMNYIEFTATPSGQAVALKVGVPHDDLFTEMETLALWNGRGAVCLLEADRELGAILMERAEPGTMLWEAGDNREQTRGAASIMTQLSVPVPASHGLPRVADQVEKAFRETRNGLDPEELMPRDLLDTAEAALRDLERQYPDEVVLHGDLHHENALLDEGRGWVAIDPKGVIGPACLEVGRFLQNQVPKGIALADREVLLRDRVEIFS